MSTAGAQPFCPTLDDLSASLAHDVFGKGDPIVVAITGGWGEGKTFFWKNTVAKDHEADKPGYVSVFGVESLAAIKREVVIEAIRTSDAVGPELYEKTKRALTVLRPLGKLSKWGLEKFGVPVEKFGLSDVLAALPELLQRVAFRPGWVLCLDDIERLSSGVGLDALFGYVNSLRDEHGINVVLIYNEARIDKGQRLEDLRRYTEKVVDRQFTFSPDIQRIFDLVFDGVFDDKALTAELVAKCKTLKLRNIRILHRFKRYYTQLLDILPKPVDPLYAKAGAVSLLLFSWLKFATDDSRDLTFEFLETYSGAWDAYFPDDDDKKPDWRVVLLGEFGYSVTDDFDRLLMQFVGSNVPDRNGLRSNYDRYLEGERGKQASERLERAWLKNYHGTLADTEADFCAEVVEAVRDGMKQISLHNIDAVLAQLDALGRKAESSALLDQLKRERPLIDEEGMFGPLRHPELRQLVKEAQRKASIDDRPLAEVIDAAVGKDYMVERDRKRLAQFSAKDYFDYFMTNPQEHLTGKIRQLVKAASVGNADEFDRKVKADVLEAIGMIAGTSRMNRERMESMGLLKLANPPASDQPPPSGRPS